MKFSMVLTFNPPEHYIPLAQAADREGWHSVNVGDGLFFFDETSVTYPYTDSGQRYWSSNTPFLDPFCIISAMGTVTRNVRFLVNVLKFPIRNPMLVAKICGTVAYITGDRLSLGVGLDVWPEDYSICQSEWKTRGARCTDGIKILRKALTGEFFEHHSKYYDIPRCSINPVPAKPMPILIGGMAEPTLKRTARYADGFVPPNLTTEQILPLMRKVDEYRKEFGTEDRPFQKIAMATDAFDLDGFKRLEDMGIDEACAMPWLLYGGKFRSPLDFKLDAIKRFGNEVISKM